MPRATKQELPSHKDLEVVDNDNMARDFVVKIKIPEFNCVCPRTGLPDFGCVYIKYIPHKFIVELKSLKLYIVKYRNVGIFHETLTNKILDDFSLACKPKKISVMGDFHPRGGIKTQVLCGDDNI